MAMRRSAQLPGLLFPLLKGDSFFNKEVIDIILCHHEKSDGSGFPFQIPYSSITDMETLLTFADNLVAFQEHKFFSGDSQIFLKKSLMEVRI